MSGLPIGRPYTDESYLKLYKIKPNITKNKANTLVIIQSGNPEV